MGIEPKKSGPKRTALGVVANGDGAFTTNDFIVGIRNEREYALGYCSGLLFSLTKYERFMSQGDRDSMKESQDLSWGEACRDSHSIKGKPNGN